MGRLEGKVAVVTGGASGIGAATARLFVAEGASVVISDMQDPAGETLARELGRATYIRTDVRDEAAVAAAVARAVEAFGRLDCMINNAGVVGAVGSIREMEARDWRDSLAILLDGAFFGVKHAARVLVEQGEGGSILSTTSVAGLRGGLGPHAYTAAKHGVVGLTRSAASELAPARVRVNAVAPGGTLTPMTAPLSGDPALAADRMAARSPMGLPLYPQAIAEAFAFLASDAAQHITAHVLPVDSGAVEVPAPASFHTMAPGYLGPR